MVRLPLLVLLSVLLVSPAFAQSGDISVRFAGYTRVPAAGYFNFNVHVDWKGQGSAKDIVLDVNLPGTIGEVRAFGNLMTCTKVNPVHCTMPEIDSVSDFATLGVSVLLPSAGTYEATATVSTSTPEAPSSNNTAVHTVTVAGLPLLRGSIIAEVDTVDPGEIGVVRMGITNDGQTATNVVYRVRVADGGEVVRVEPQEWGSGPPQSQCEVVNGEGVCRLATLGERRYEIVRVYFRAPNRREGGKAVLLGSVESDAANFDPTWASFQAEIPLRRMFVVTSSADDGSGTLRQAIFDSQSQCAFLPCTIAFEGVSAIRPVTPLPDLRGTMRIDGREARVEIDGSQLTSGDGLHFSGGCELQVRNLAIRNFPNHAIEAWQTAEDFNACRDGRQYADGLYVTRTVLSGNTRGIVAKGIDVSLRENVIHDQRRAGIFIDGSYYSYVKNNIIVGSGASGIFINPSTGSRWGGIPGGGEIIENVIHSNVEWGVARTANGLVQVSQNSIYDNGLYAIDVGLDLATPNRTEPGPGVPNKPTLISATYDPVSNKTVIRGIAPGGGKVDLYASRSLSRRGYPEAEKWLTQDWATGTFEKSVDGDLRGQWITSTNSLFTTLYFLRSEAGPATNVYRGPTGVNTSELSDAVQVQ